MIGERPTFFENIAAGVDALGVENAPIIWGIARTIWPTAVARDDFLALIAKQRA